MTLTEARRWVVPLAPYAALVVVALLLVRGCNRASRAEAERDRLAEQIRLEHDGLEVADPEPDLGPEVTRLTGENAELRAELDRARRAAPGARPTGTLSAATTPAPAGGAPRAEAPTVPGAIPSAAPTCVLARGDLLQLRVSEVDLTTEAGNVVVVGTSEAWRISPGEPSLLQRAPWRETRAVVEASKALEPAGWGVGPAGGVTGAGWLAGVTLLTPERRIPILGRPGGLVLSGAGGPGGWVGLASVYLRP